jgi:hypothetical protein
MMQVQSSVRHETQIPKNAKSREGRQEERNRKYIPPWQSTVGRSQSGLDGAQEKKAKGLKQSEESWFGDGDGYRSKWAARDGECLATEDFVNE